MNTASTASVDEINSLFPLYNTWFIDVSWWPLFADLWLWHFTLIADRAVVNRVSCERSLRINKVERERGSEEARNIQNLTPNMLWMSFVVDFLTSTLIM